MAKSEKFWQEVYTTLAPKMLGVCRRYVNDIALAEDLMHDSFIKAIEKSNTYKGSGSLAAWLHRITVNTVLMHLRESKRFATSSFHDVAEHIPEDETASGKATEGDRVSIENAEFTQEELLRMLDLLPDHHRAVFNLYVIDGYTHNQIGELLGLSAGTSKSHLARARRKLQEILLKRAQEMEQRKKERKKRAVFYIPVFAGSKHAVDRIFAESFRDFSITPTGSFDALAAISSIQPIPASNALITLKSALFLGSASVAAILAIVFFIKTNNSAPESIQPVYFKPDSVAINQNTVDSTFHTQIDSTVSNTDSTKRSKLDIKKVKTPVIIKKQIVVKDTVYIYDDEKE